MTEQELLKSILENKESNTETFFPVKNMIAYKKWKGDV